MNLQKLYKKLIVVFVILALASAMTVVASTTQNQTQQTQNVNQNRFVRDDGVVFEIRDDVLFVDAGRQRMTFSRLNSQWNSIEAINRQLGTRRIEPICEQTFEWFHGRGTAPVQEQENKQNIVPLSQVPRFAQERSVEESNGLVVQVIEDYIRTLQRNHRNMQANDFRITPQMQRESDQFIERLIQACIDDPRMKILGLNEHGIRALLQGVSLFPMKSNGGATGLWFIDQRNAFVCIESSGDMQEKVRTALYELFGRNLGYDAHLSGTIAEYVMDSGPALFPSAYWSGYTGFHHSLGQKFGYDKMFGAADNGQEYFGEWMNEHIPLLNKDFKFDYSDLMRAFAGAGAVLWGQPDITRQFRRETGVNDWDTWQHFASIWDRDGLATNVNGNRFNQMIMDNARRARDNNIVFAWATPYQMSLDIDQMPSVNDYTQATKDLNNPAAGIMIRQMHEQRR
ncbi:MAG: hypothetical protein FWE90_00020 [Defluviitaleaceae bacterium]|nr:hypothetical protein [Defluviitaleaceae bacterium]